MTLISPKNSIKKERNHARRLIARYAVAVESLLLIVAADIQPAVKKIFKNINMFRLINK